MYATLGAVVTDCRIVTNTVDGVNRGRGGGVLLGGGIITNCLVSDNRIVYGNYWGGGGVHIASAGGTVSGMAAMGRLDCFFS